jgi:hypothetical protein
MTCDWFKLWHEALDDPKFLGIADRIKSKPGDVFHVFMKLLKRASENDDRGSILGFDDWGEAAWLRIPVEEVRRIVEAICSIGMIAGDRIAKWTKRQGAAAAKLVKPPTAHALRQRRYVRRKAEDDRQSASAFTKPAEPAGVADGVTPVTSGVTEGVTSGVTVTPESDNIENKGGTPLYPPLAGGEDAIRPRLLVDNSGGKDGRGARGSRLPIDWQPGPEDRFFAESVGLNPDDTVAEFRDYWCPKSRARSLDWNAEWRTHCRRKSERQHPRPGRRSPHATHFNAALAVGLRMERAQRLSRGETVDPYPQWGMATAGR